MNNLRELNPYDQSYFHNCDAGYQACKTYEADIIAWGANPPDPNGNPDQMILLNGKRITRLDIDGVNALQVNERRYQGKFHCSIITTIIAGIAAVILAATGVTFGIIAAAGVTLLFIGLLSCNKYNINQIQKEIGYQSLFDARDYFIKGPGERAGMNAQNIVHVVHGLPDLVQRIHDLPGGDPAQGALEAARMRARQQNQHLERTHKDGCLHRAFVQLKAQNAQMAARVVAKLFQGNRTDPEVVQFEQSYRQELAKAVQAHAH